MELFIIVLIAVIGTYYIAKAKKAGKKRSKQPTAPYESPTMQYPQSAPGVYPDYLVHDPEQRNYDR